MHKNQDKNNIQVNKRKKPSNPVRIEKDIDIRKSGDGSVKVIALVIGGCTAFVLLFALTVAGFYVWRIKRTPVVQTPLPRANLGPINPPPFQPPRPPQLQGIAPPAGLQPLPSLPNVVPANAGPQRPVERQVQIEAVRNFTGHAGPVFSVAISTAEHRAISGGSDRTVRLWDLDNGKELAVLSGHTAAVREVVFAPDGKRAVSASNDGTLRLWDVAEKKTLRTFTGHKGDATCVAFVTDGKRLLSGGADRSLRVWEVESGKLLQEWYGHEAAILSVSVAPDGAHALTGSADGDAVYWDLETGRELCHLVTGKPVHFALFTPDGKHAVVGGDAATHLCDLNNAEQWIEEFGEAHWRGAAVMPGGNVVLKGGENKRLEGRALRRRHFDEQPFPDPGSNPLGQVEAHLGTVYCVRLAADGRLALTAGADGLVKLWRIAEGRPLP